MAKTVVLGIRMEKETRKALEKKVEEESKKTGYTISASALAEKIIKEYLKK